MLRLNHVVAGTTLLDILCFGCIQTFQVCETWKV